MVTTIVCAFYNHKTSRAFPGRFALWVTVRGIFRTIHIIRGYGITFVNCLRIMIKPLPFNKGQ